MRTKAPTKKRANSGLNGTRVDSYLFDPDELVIIGIDTKDGPEHPLYDPKIKRPLNEARVLNVKRYGVKKNVLVRKDGDRAIVVDGRTRTRWGREANKRLRAEGQEPIRIPVTVTRCSDEDAHDLMVALNEVREDEDPIARAKKMQRLMDRGRSFEEVALVYGVTVVTAKKLLALLDLADGIQKKVAAGELGVGEAGKLSKLSREEQTKAVEERSRAREAGEKAPRLPGERPARPGKRVVLKVADSIGGLGRALLRWSAGEEPENDDAARQVAELLEKAAVR